MYEFLIKIYSDCGIVAWEHDADPSHVKPIHVQYIADINSLDDKSGQAPTVLRGRNNEVNGALSTAVDKRWKA